MMSEGYSKLRNTLNIEKCGAIGSLDLQEGRELKEEDMGGDLGGPPMHLSPQYLEK